MSNRLGSIIYQDIQVRITIQDILYELRNLTYVPKVQAINIEMVIPFLVIGLFQITHCSIVWKSGEGDYFCTRPKHS